MHRLWKESQQKLVFLHNNLEHSDRWRGQLSLSLQLLVCKQTNKQTNKHSTNILIFNKNSKYHCHCRYITRVCRPARKHISVEILCAGIKQIATLCYHQHKLNGANLKHGAMNIIPLNIWKTNNLTFQKVTKSFNNVLGNRSKLKSPRYSSKFL